MSEVKDTVKEYVVVYGSLHEGFMFYGPFKYRQEAEEWAKKEQFKNPNGWTVQELFPPLD